ncbi:LuxR C-terminal-related transcriptional regulator [uncultured Tateyamaria sp.]|uniref:LuxR C-terminal-related transcriptional regulator n=1 Tax=uncultured Tateyamaria sp. TaxID=455651 RepID=UPI002613EDE9|nr:LuxR C-terminal-related transcriptional regulator [uncultured Tateyamaria sp.]
MIDPNSPQPRDMASLLGGAFPGHTMQRLRTPGGAYRYSYVSSEVQAAFGLDAHALMAETAVDHAWIHADDRGRFIAALEHSAEHLTTLDEEVRVLLQSGGTKWVRSLGQPRRMEDGTVIWDGVALDVTDRREALMALERALSDARRNEVSESRFAAIATQDMLQPLNTLAEAVAALKIQSSMDPESVSPQVVEVLRSFEDFTRALSAARSMVEANPAQIERKQATRSATHAALTARQLEIMRLVQAGASNQEIAEALSITVGTVKLHISKILKRIGARNRTEATRLCFG